MNGKAQSYQRSDHSFDAMSASGTDHNALLGKPESKSIMDDLGLQFSQPDKRKVGAYSPSEFEARLVQPAYALEPASPSSDLEQFMNTPENVKQALKDNSVAA